MVQSKFEISAWRFNKHHEETLAWSKIFDIIGEHTTDLYYLDCEHIRAPKNGIMDNELVYLRIVKK